LRSNLKPSSEESYRLSEDYGYQGRTRFDRRGCCPSEARSNSCGSSHSNGVSPGSLGFAYTHSTAFSGRSSTNQDAVDTLSPFEGDVAVACPSLLDEQGPPLYGTSPPWY